MPIRLAACDPCRIAKVSCDHQRPVCGRCQEAERSCIYRDRPFKKRKLSPTEVPPSNHNGSDHPRNILSPAIADAASHAYPNPLYLGRSSHATIFEQITANNSPIHNPDSSNDTLGRAFNVHGDSHVRTEASFVGAIRESLDVKVCTKLVRAWMTRGTNLALAGSIITACVDAAFHLFSESGRSDMDISRQLFTSSSGMLVVTATTTLEQIRAQLKNDATCWETLGLFFVAVSRAATDVERFEACYESKAQRRGFQKQILQLADHCLELSLSLDGLSDLQLLLQYENWIAHSMIDGDQSYRSWRKLGDVISSLSALGYHERVDHNRDTSDVMKEIRRAAFARAYSADKNVSIFLGRPYRMQRQYCSIDLYVSDLKAACIELREGQFDYVLETWWTAACAVLKERVVELSKKTDSTARAQKASTIMADANGLWESLPAAFRLESNLKQCDRRPVEKDFLASAKLNHLHILFLLRLELRRHNSEPDPELTKIAASMLSLTVEACVLKDHLANSGTGLLWKVAFYGLPAAGIVCLSLLNRSLSTATPGPAVPNVIQDLSVFVAHVETGALISIEEPNYPLLTGAAETIKSLLNRVLSPCFIANQPQEQRQLLQQPFVANQDFDNWMPWTADQDLGDFELDFWLHLADHPALNAPPAEIAG